MDVRPNTLRALGLQLRRHLCRRISHVSDRTFTVLHGHVVDSTLRWFHHACWLAHEDSLTSGVLLVAENLKN